MHEREKKDLEVAELRGLLIQAFKGITPDESAARRAVDRFLTVVEERTGLLAARGEGIYAFSHLTFQEYLAALAVAARDDYVEFVLKHSSEAWWREVILLTAGYLSTQSKERTTKLVRAIAKSANEPELFHNLILAIECLHDAGSNRVIGNLESEMRLFLKTEVERPIPEIFDPVKAVWFERLTGYAEKKKVNSEKLRRMVVERRQAAMNTLSRIGFHWYPPYGEPEWITIPAGMFWMGEGIQAHRLFLPEYQISRVPVTNAQYALFLNASNYQSPGHFEEGRPPKAKESHPVVNVTWYDAIAYCEWLGQVTGKQVTLPSEAEWEKAARGDKDKRNYPWGDEFNSSKCNTEEIGLNDTTPVGIFLEGASPYGLLDMSGNVWEWTSSIFGRWEKSKVVDEYKYPYDAKDGREALDKSNDYLRSLRGGSFASNRDYAHCAYRSSNDPDSKYRYCGFRVLVVGFSSR